MKKTYNVYSTKMTLKSLKALSMSFIFALFFLGMSSSVNAQSIASSATAAALEADFAITQKAKITLSDEDALAILETELVKTRLEARDATAPLVEAESMAKKTFLEKTIFELTAKDASMNDALFKGHAEMAQQISRFNDATRLSVKADIIARNVIERLK